MGLLVHAPGAAAVKATDFVVVHEGDHFFRRPRAHAACESAAPADDASGGWATTRRACG